MARLSDPRKPALPVSIDEDPEHVLIQSDGEIRRHYTLVFSPEDCERIRLGYCCLNCGESQVDHGAPFPEECWVCHFPMRAKQAERYASEFVGEMKVGPQTSIQDEMEIAREFVERENHKPKPSIIVPGGFH